MTQAVGIIVIALPHPNAGLREVARDIRIANADADAFGRHMLQKVFDDPAAKLAGRASHNEHVSSPWWVSHVVSDCGLVEKD